MPDTRESDSASRDSSRQETLHSVRLRLAGFLCTLAVSTSAIGQNIDLVYLFSDGQIPVTFQAYESLLNEHPELRGRVTLQFITESVFNDVDVADVLAADVLVVDIMNEQMLQRFNTAHDVDLIATIGRNGHVFAVGEGMLPEAHYTDQGAIWDTRTRAYWRYSGADNHLGLMKAILQNSGIDDLIVPQPLVSLDFAYYYPDDGNGRLFRNWDDFDTWRHEAKKVSPGAPRVAVGFYKANYYGGDMAVLDALIAEIERQGAEAIPFFGYPGATAFARMLIDENDDPRADVALSFLFRFADFQSARTLETLDIPVLNLITLYGRSEAQWRNSSTGLSIFEGTFQVAVPELAGLTAPAVVGGRETVIDADSGLAVVRTKPIASRLPITVKRALNYAALRTKDNHDKHIALVYYNYPPGKAGIGASYLNVADSLANILQRLKSEGYDLGNDADAVNLDSESILKKITVEARNVGSYAPGELDAMLDSSNPVRVSMQDYTHWLDALAPSLKTKIIADWGDPDDTDLMAVQNADGSKSLIVPLVRFGNVILLPQTVRGWGEDQEKLYHAKDLSPHHQYVATYTWLRNEFGADAVVHIGTHGTLEWFDGKDVGQSADDASDALISDMPHLYIYNVDVVGEGLVARRRGLATLVDHMVPPFTTAGLYADLALLDELISDYQSNLSKNAELAAVYATQIRQQVLRLGIAQDLDLDPSRIAREDDFDDHLHEIEDYVLELKGQNIPFGLHAFGRIPSDAARRSTAEAIAAIDRSQLPNKDTITAADIENRIVLSAKREMDGLIAGLNGSFIPAGSGGEPLRNPDAYPTGKNFYGIDPDKVPKPAAWQLGVTLAEQMLSQHLDDHGRYPEKVSFVIWGDETMRHEGVLESQIFFLLGTRPVWNERGKLVDVEIIPHSELKRPRIDIVIASAAEGMFNNVTLLMDKAVQRVKSLDEDENYVRQHYLAAREKLIDLGYAEEDADRRAGVRIFDEPPGTYNLNTSNIVEASGSWSSDQVIGDDYLRKMGHGFGNGFWGEPMPDAFRLALSGTDQVVHSSSTMLYGALDNDDFYMYMGGLSSAIRNLDGTNPDLVVTNTRDPGNPKMSSINEFIGSEMRSRYLNPKWIKGMQEEGYAGALEMRAFVENLWGWDATVNSTVDDAMWQAAFSTYVQDKHELKMQEFFEGNSPFAFQDISARMMETIRKGYWKTDDATLTRLMDRYISSVNDNGIGCSENTCGNPLLMKYVIDNATAAGIPEPTVSQFRDTLESATKDTIENQAKLAEDFIRQNEDRAADKPVSGPESITTPTLESVELQQYLAQENDSPEAVTSVDGSPAKAFERNTLRWVMLLMVLLGGGLFWRKKFST